MRYYLLILVTFLLTSCGVQWKYTTLNTAAQYDAIYGVTDSGDTLKVDVIDNRFDLDRKFRFDNKFRWNYSMYAMNQDYIWHQDFFWRNRMFRNGYGFSSWDFYWNRHDFWWNWSAGYPFNYGFSYWNNWGWHRDPFYQRPGWNYGIYGYNNWGWRNRMNDYVWEHRDRRNVVYVNGRRGSNNVVTSNGNRRGSTNNVLSNPNIRINRGRRSTPPTLDNEDLVIKDKPNLIDRLVRKIENSSGIRVRTYKNPNNVPNNNNRIRNYNRTNNNNIRNYNVPRTNSNPPRVSPSRSSSPPSVIRSNSSRSSGNVSVSRGSNRRINN
jgi:hypothetical protein